MSYFFTSESVSEGHPDKVSDQISDALLDEFLKHDPNSKVACETLVTTGLIMLAGEVRTSGYVDVQETARKVVKEIGYIKPEYRFDYNSCGVISSIHEQSSDIFQGVARTNPEDQGAGDQGIMFGYASTQMDNFMPIEIELSHILLQELAAIRKEGKEMTYLRPDSKSQVTVEYDDKHNAVRIDTIVVSTQHDDFDEDETMLAKIKEDVKNILLPRVEKVIPQRVKGLFNDNMKLYVNPTGKFVIGGPHGDTGLTGRKIIVDTYGGRSPHGGGAFSGKDSSKVDRSAAYALRHIAKNMVAAGIADDVVVQASYAIGIAQPMSVFVNTNGTAKVRKEDGSIMPDGEIASVIQKVFDLRPYHIVKRFGLKNPIFLPTASYGHFGRDHYIKEVEVYYKDEETIERVENGKTRYFKDVEFFGWEKLDFVDALKKEFNL